MGSEHYLARLTARGVDLGALASMAPGEWTSADIAQAAGRVRPRLNFEAMLVAYCHNSVAMSELSRSAMRIIAERAPSTGLALIGAQMLANLAVRELVLDRDARRFSELERAKQVGVSLGQWRRLLAQPYSRLLGELQSRADEGARDMLAHLG